VTETTGRYYSFALDAEPLCTFTFCSDGGSASYDVWLCLFDRDWNLLAENDDTCGLSSEISVVLAPGAYRIAVSGFRDRAGTYRLAYSRSGGEGPRFRRGDANGDRSFDITDAVVILEHLFFGRSILCRDAADSNDDGDPDISDAVVVLVCLFNGGVCPPRPYPDCGTDPTADGLDCERFLSCN
jgi:hypothetical protein